MARLWIIALAVADLGSATLMAEQVALHLDDDIGISARIPVSGELVRIQVPVRNASASQIRDTYRLTAWVSRAEQAPVKLTTTDLKLDLQPGATKDVEVFWRPKATGFYKFRFHLEKAGSLMHQVNFGPVAVVARRLYFAWFGAPRHFQWCNVPTTVKPEETAWWLRRGALPCAWKGAVCYKEWPIERFVAHYGEDKWIAIDEIGGPGEDTDKFMAALREAKRRQPDRFTAVWFMGAHDYWSEVTDVVDLFIPEVYLNYRGNHLGIFEPYIECARRAGVMDRMVCGLGINVINDDKTGEPRVIPTKEDVLRQIRHLKRIAPDMPGVSFFTSYSAAEGVAEYADELCGEYFVKPVVTLSELRLCLEPKGRARAVVSVANHGGMSAHGVELKIAQEFPEGRLGVEQVITLKELSPGKRRDLSVNLANRSGISKVRAELVPSSQYTVLDAQAEEFFVPNGSELASKLGDTLALVYLPPWEEGERIDVPLWLVLDKPAQAAQVLEIDRTGRVIQSLPAFLAVESEGNVVRWVASDRTGPDECRFYAVVQALSEHADLPELYAEEENGRLEIVSPYYRAELNPGADAIVSLVPAGSNTQLLKSPWVLRCPGHESFGAPEIARAPGWLSVRIPFSSELATGYSRYVFSAFTPAIEIFRSVVPRAPITLDGAGEGCHLEQRGGSYALQPGVGGVISRGLLIDTTEYRDLYFGYLGDAPGERNAKLAGWIDFSWAPSWHAGLGVVIAERWKAAASRSYDVTRLYDASDWLEVCYVWNTQTTVDQQQSSRLFLVPHTYVDMQDTTVPPARAVWETVHKPVRQVPG